MTSVNFCYWLQGYIELQGGGHGLTETQLACVKRHLAMVFAHEIDPSMGDVPHQAQLDELHNPQGSAPSDVGVPPFPFGHPIDVPGGVRLKC